MSEIKKRTTIGGQALIEGILMRGPKKTAIVVRKKNGEHVIKEEPVGTNSHAAFWKLPFIRGAVNLWDSMKYGVSALEYSASFFEDDEDYVPSKFENWIYGKFGKQKVDDAMMMVAVVIGCLMPVGLFMLLPTILAGLFSFIESNFLKNLLEGCIRIAIFLAFVIITSKQSDVHRTYMYHGAEHKTIFCYEAGLELNVENVRKQSRFHPRCGTSFMILMILVSVVVSTVAQIIFPGVYAVAWLWVIVKILLVPVCCGVGYELLKFCGRHDNFLTRIIAAPGLWLQRLTTVEPEDDMLEIAAAALTAVIPENAEDDRW